MINSPKHQKFESNWLQKSLENLEKSIWPALDPDEGSYLIQTCHALRKKPLKDFSIEDLREMIGQDIGIRFLIPLAIEELQRNILAEGDLYEGDLLKSVLTSDENYWRENRTNWQAVCDLMDQNRELLENADVTRSIKKGWFDAFVKFKAL